MKLVFADTYYFLALLNPRDQDHERVVEFSSTWNGHLLTSEYVLLEVADALSKPIYRPRFLLLIDELKMNESVEIIPANPDSIEKGISLYRARQDKEWTLTDCISMTIMKDKKVVDVLTADVHYKQAGFAPVFLKVTG